MEGDSINTFRVLIVDDSKQTHEIFNRLLNLQGKMQFSTKAKEKNFNSSLFPTFSVDSSFQGKDAVELVRQSIVENEPYALAFVDIRMPPGWDGLETIKRIWELDKNIQIVICTAYSDYSWEETVTDLAAFDNFLILKKPFDGITVRQIACSLTRKWQLAQEAFQNTQLLEQEIKVRTDELLHSAMHDSLTNLPNRFLLLQQLNVLMNALPPKKILAVFLLDLDRFKFINDSLTHAMGDTLLQAVAERLKEASLESHYLLARLGGDEFVIVLSHLNDLLEITQRAQYYLNVLYQSFQIANQDLRISASIGVSIYPGSGDTGEMLIRNADIAMYQAKERGPNSFQIYTESMNSFSVEQLKLENELLRSLEKNELVLHYQPEIDINTGELKGVEALIRWQHPVRGLVAPMNFVPLAEQTGFILPMGEWVLRTACKQNKMWQEKGFKKIRIAVNVSGRQFEQTNLVEMVKNVLKETELDPEFLELEVTENIIIGEGIIIENVRAIKETGVHIALDDFGSEHSNLQHLKKLAFDRIKIDKSYIDNINIRAEDEAIIRAVISMAESLNVRVLAEGVELQQQLDFLKKEGCHEVQGFYFSEALPSDMLEKYFISMQNPSSKK
ncbi:MAG: EAL domain-containing protein [Gammaproteobacteria bacterium]|nr:EAL domain-containing protein [Gammaproteobacteria bacterium]